MRDVAPIGCGTLDRTVHICVWFLDLLNQIYKVISEKYFLLYEWVTSGVSKSFS